VSSSLILLACQQSGHRSLMDLRLTRGCSRAGAGEGGGGGEVGRLRPRVVGGACGGRDEFAFKWLVSPGQTALSRQLASPAVAKRERLGASNYSEETFRNLNPRRQRSSSSFPLLSSLGHQATPTSLIAPISQINTTTKRAFPKRMTILISEFQRKRQELQLQPS